MPGSKAKQRQRARDLRAWLQWEKGSSSKHAKRLRQLLESEARRKGYGEQKKLV